MKKLTAQAKTAIGVVCFLTLTIPIAHSVSAGSTKQKLNTPLPRSVVVGKTFTTAANRGTKIVLSQAGNLLEFKSPNIGGAQYDHIIAGARSEGYVLCYNGLRVWDTGTSQSGFAPSTSSNSTLTGITIKRKTTDGVLELTQVFNAPVAGQALGIVMTVKNLSASTVNNIILRRQVDFDVDTGGTQGWSNFSNRFLRTSVDGVVAWNDPADAPLGREAHAMLLRTEKASASVIPKVTADILDNSCSPASVVTPTGRVDNGATLEFALGALPTTASATANMRYVRF